MATLAPGTRVTLRPEYEDALAFGPPASLDLVVSVHPDALRVGKENLHTQLVAMDDTEIKWAGAIDEQMLSEVESHTESPRGSLADGLLRGGRLWTAIDPGDLLRRKISKPLTIYRGERPWIVVGELPEGALLAVPLNEPTNPKWYAPVVDGSCLDFEGSKTSQAELAHVWSFDRSLDSIGGALAECQKQIESAIRRYFYL